MKEQHDFGAFFAIPFLLVGLVFIGFMIYNLTQLQNSLPKIKTLVKNGTTTTEIINSSPTYNLATTTIINGDTTTTQILQWKVSK